MLSLRMKCSAGILLYRLSSEHEIEFFLVHPGGPFFLKKDEGSWTIPKGEIDADEDPLDAATREFAEETGSQLSGNFVSLGEIKQKAGKRVAAWAVQGDLDPATITSNEFEIEWPPRSGRIRKFPEIDKAGWFNLEAASKKINPAQVPLLERLIELII
jgi:predicted NUDIX family NTP pyrophosphohydrolase